MRSQWNDDEDAALQGLTPDAQVIYLRGFRRYMGYSSGVAGGPHRRLSYKALAELISVDPDWGSTRGRGVVPTLGRVRAKVAELERAGLLVNHGSCRAYGLVFKLPLADTGSVRPEKEQHGERHGEQHVGNVVKLPKNQEIAADNQGATDTGSSTGSNTHLYNSTELNSTTGARDNEVRPDDYRPQKPDEWGSFLACERHWAYHRVSKPKLIIAYQRWTRLGLSVGDMREIMACAEASLGRTPDGPEWYRSFAESYAQERDRLSQEIQNQQQRGVHGTGAPGQRSRSRRAEQDEVRRQLSDPEYAIQNW